MAQITISDHLYIAHAHDQWPSLMALSTFRRKGRLRAKQKRVVRYYKGLKDGRLVLPRGLLSRVRKILPGAPLLDARFAVRPVDFGFRWELRDYQNAAVNAILKQGEGVVVAPPASGKTVMGLALAAAWHQPTLFLVHTLRLVDQTKDKARHVLTLPRGGLGVVADSAKQYGSHLTIATIQTLAKKPRYVRELAQRVGTVIVDECVVGDTKVEGKPIRDIREGDAVWTYDVARAKWARNPVTHVFRRSAPDALIRIDAGGCSLVCTANHPIWTQDGWKRADALTTNDHVLIKGGRTGGQDSFSADGSVSLVRKAGTTESQVALRRMEACRSCLLFSGMWKSIQAQSQLRDDGQNQSQVRLRPHEETQSYEPRRCAPARQSVPSGYWPQTDHSGGERSADARTTTDSIRSDGVADRSSCKNLYAPRIGLSPGVQDRCGEQGIDGRDRDRRGIPLRLSATGSGCEERGTAEWLRLDRLAVLEQGRDAEFDQVCRDGLVYNLEVAGPHTFVANGIITHNCHHSPSESFQKVVNSFPAKFRAGLSGTPNRADGLGPVITALLGPRVVIPRKILRDRGVIMDPTIYLVETAWMPPESVSYSISERVRSQDPLRNALAARIVWTARQKRQRVLVLVELERHAFILADILSKSHIPAYPVVGRLSTTVQDQRFKAMEEGKAVVVATKLANEGLDWPALDCLVMATPGRSATVLEQRTGRIARTSPGKQLASVYDLVDSHSEVYLNQYLARLETYREMGYRIRRWTIPNAQ